MRSQPSSRPVSLLVALPGEEDSLLHPNSLSGEEMYLQGPRQSSISTLSKVASTLRGTRRNTLVSAPAVTITPAGSESSEDESTPLMSELSSPIHTQPAFTSPLSSDLSPPSHGPQEYLTLCQGEISTSCQLLRSISRQNAFDSDEEVTSPWGDPETTV